MKRTIAAAVVALTAFVGTNANAQTVTVVGPKLPYEYTTDANANGAMFNCAYGTLSTFRLYQNNGRILVVGFTDNATYAQVQERLTTGAHPTNYCIAGAGAGMSLKINPSSIRITSKVAG